MSREKTSPFPLVRGMLFGLHPARSRLLRALSACHGHLERDPAPAQLLVISRRFHVSDGGSTPSTRESTQARIVFSRQHVNLDPMGASMPTALLACARRHMIVLTPSVMDAPQPQLLNHI